MTLPTPDMLSYLRYALATVCFAASVGCLLLCYGGLRRVHVRIPATGHVVQLEAFTGTGFISLPSWFQESASPSDLPKQAIVELRTHQESSGRFGVIRSRIYFPGWYPSLIFALAGMGILRVGRFTIRSAIIGTTVVVGLLGMAVIL